MLLKGGNEKRDQDKGLKGEEDRQVEGDRNMEVPLLLSPYVIYNDGIGGFDGYGPN